MVSDALCRFVDRDGAIVCERCGYRAAFGVAVLRACAAGDAPKYATGATCRNLGAATGRVVLVRCQTCTGHVRVKHSVHACAVHGECLPDVQADGERSCAGCGSFVVAGPAS